MRASRCLSLIALSSLAFAGPAAAATHLMRFADVHDSQVVFTYEGDLWIASTAGGDARRITNDPGDERYAKFSPDGTQIAFTGNLDGGRDVYVMDARGGIPRRLTYHPAADNVLDWFPDGKSILFRSHRGAAPGDQLYRVPVDGGMETRLPVDRAGLTALSPDGHRIAYNRISREFATWKRYQGGMAQSIWMGSLDRGDFEKITDWAGTSSWPMWQADAIYFVSDRERGTMNLYRYDLATKQTTALTHYDDYDVKYPSIGPGGIVFQYGEQLWLLDVGRAGATPRRLDIEVRTGLTSMRPWFVDVTKNHGSFALSPDAGRMLLEVRGEILSLPVEKTKGEPLNLTHASGSREKNLACSPDGRRVAFLSDRTGEEEVWLADARGDGDWKQLTKGNKGFRLQPVWSPDGKWLVFSDKFMRLNLVDASSGAIQVVARGRIDDGWERWGIQDYVWSPDSRWIVYTRMDDNLNETIHAYSLASRKTLDLTDDRFTSWSPSFAPDGRTLYFLSDRTFNPIMGTIDQEHVFLNMTRPYALVLRAADHSPFEPEEPGAAAEGDHEKGASESKRPAPTVVIDPGDFERRTVAVPGVEPGDYFRLEAVADGFLYLAQPKNHFDKYMTVTDLTDGKLELWHYVVHPERGKEREPQKLIEGIANYHLSGDRKRLVYRTGHDYGVLDTGEKGKPGDGKVDLSAVDLKIDRREEYLQIFNEAWRVQRDWFYDPGMHGVDWDAVGAMYRSFVPDCGTRSDLVYLIGEMIAELNAGHTYSYGGDEVSTPKRIATGMLGVDFDTPAGSPYHRIARIVPGHGWNDAEASPLAAPGCPVRDGDYLIAINGREVTSRDNVYAFLEDAADHWVTVTTNSRPTKAGARTCRVHALGSEGALRYRDWVDANRAYVDRVSGGRIGYVHMSDMGEDGLRQFARDFHAQHGKQGMIVDVRNNGGGFVSDMIIDRMERKPWSITVAREGDARLVNPEGVFVGHYAVLINEETGSNGEYFGRTIQIRKLAPVIGMRTWGGAIGIQLHQPLIDGGQTTPPQFGTYELDRRWVYEGRGVEPDVEVQNMPADVLRGHDAQLDAAIASITRRLETEPVALPAPPPYPRKAK